MALTVYFNIKQLEHNSFLKIYQVYGAPLASCEIANLILILNFKMNFEIGFEIEFNIELEFESEFKVELDIEVESEFEIEFDFESESEFNACMESVF